MEKKTKKLFEKCKKDNVFIVNGKVVKPKYGFSKGAKNFINNIEKKEEKKRKIIKAKRIKKKN